MFWKSKNLIFFLNVSICMWEGMFKTKNSLKSFFNIFLLIQIGKKNENFFLVILYFVHNFLQQLRKNTFPYIFTELVPPPTPHHPFSKDDTPYAHRTQGHWAIWGVNLNIFRNLMALKQSMIYFYKHLKAQIPWCTIPHPTKENR